MGYFSGTEIGRLLSRLMRRDSLSAEANHAQELEDGINQLKKQWGHRGHATTGQPMQNTAKVSGEGLA